MVTHAAFELLGIGAIYPVIDLAMPPDIIGNNSLYFRIYDFFRFSGYRQFVLILIALESSLHSKLLFLPYFR